MWLMHHRETRVISDSVNNPKNSKIFLNDNTRFGQDLMNPDRVILVNKSAIFSHQRDIIPSTSF